MTVEYNPEIGCYEWTIGENFDADLKYIKQNAEITKIAIKRGDPYKYLESTLTAFKNLNEIDHVKTIELGEATENGALRIGILDIPNIKSILENPKLKSVNLFWDGVDHVTDVELTQIVSKLQADNNKLSNAIGITEEELKVYKEETSYRLNPDEAFDRSGKSPEQNAEIVKKFNEKMAGYVRKIIIDAKDTNKLSYVQLEYFKPLLSSFDDPKELVKGKHRIPPIYSNMNNGDITFDSIVKHLQDYQDKNKYDKSDLVIRGSVRGGTVSVGTLKEIFEQAKTNPDLGGVKNIRFAKGASIKVESSTEMEELMKMAASKDLNISLEGIKISGMGRFDEVNTLDAKAAFERKDQVTPEETNARHIRRTIMSNFDIETDKNYVIRTTTPKNDTFLSALKANPLMAPFAAVMYTARKGAQMVSGQNSVWDNIGAAYVDVKEANTKITTVLNQALKEVLSEDKDLAAKIMEKCNGNDAEIQKISKQLIRDIVPKLKEEGLKMQKDGISDWGTRFTYIKEYISAWCQQTFRKNPEPMKEFEQKYKDKVVVAGNSKLLISDKESVNKVKNTLHESMRNVKFTDKESIRRDDNKRNSGHDGRC